MTPRVLNVQFSPSVIHMESWRVRGPTATKVRKPVTSMVMSGVRRKSVVPDRRLWSHFSMTDIIKATQIMGMTMAW